MDKLPENPNGSYLPIFSNYKYILANNWRPFKNLKI